MASSALEITPGPLLSLSRVSKVYGDDESTAVWALDSVDLDVRPGERIAITGASGSGKSTVMNILGCLDLPTSGEYRIEGIPVQDLPPDVLAVLRRSRFGFIFQSYNLLPRTPAIENVALPLLYAGVGRAQRLARAAAALDEVGLAGRETARTNQLSGGQQQRVAIARALVTDPEVILADEPTGNLDSRTGADVMKLLLRLNRDRGITLVVVTHDPKYAAYLTRQIVFSDGRIVSDIRRDEGGAG